MYFFLDYRKHPRVLPVSGPWPLLWGCTSWSAISAVCWLCIWNWSPAKFSKKCSWKQWTFLLGSACDCHCVLSMVVMSPAMAASLSSCIVQRFPVANNGRSQSRLIQTWPALSIQYWVYCFVFSSVVSHPNWAWYCYIMRNAAQGVLIHDQGQTAQVKCALKQTKHHQLLPPPTPVVCLCLLKHQCAFRYALNPSS